MSLLSNKELMTYIESALYSSQEMGNRYSSSEAYHHLYFSFENLFKMVEKHQKEMDEVLINFKPFVPKYGGDDITAVNPFYKDVDNGDVEPI